jgi:hypothetical protein
MVNRRAGPLSVIELPPEVLGCDENVSPHRRVSRGGLRRRRCLTITHSGRGVFSTETWERVARNTEPAYPEDGIGFGIGPIEGQAIRVTEMDLDREQMRLLSPDGRIVLECESSGIAVTIADA